MAYEVNILADSINEDEERLTSFEVTLPRIVLAELNTHRVLSRNSASSRAIPVERQLGRILDDPFVPTRWGANQPGMQADAELPAEEAAEAQALWLRCRDRALLGAVAFNGGVERLKDESLVSRILEIEDETGIYEQPLRTPVHKELSNRLLEPYMWHTVLITATEISNFLALRAVSKKAQAEIRTAARMMMSERQRSEPHLLSTDEWHLPLVQEDEKDLPQADLLRIAVGRCARISYKTHHGVRDPAEDIALHDRLFSDGHMSPFEHVARPLTATERAESLWSGNFRGWHQYRKQLPHEDDFSSVLRERGVSIDF